MTRNILDEPRVLTILKRSFSELGKSLVFPPVSGRFQIPSLTHNSKTLFLIVLAGNNKTPQTFSEV